jgi:hypothetical protein
MCKEKPTAAVHFSMLCESDLKVVQLELSKKDAKQDFAICENMACKEINYKL